jgi:hypothetical protein
LINCVVRHGVRSSLGLRLGMMRLPLTRLRR